MEASINTSYRDLTTSGSKTDQLKSNHGGKLATSVSIANQIHRGTDKAEEKSCGVEVGGEVRSYIQESKRSIQNMEVKVDTAIQKATEVQKKNKDLEASVHSELSHAQQQLQHVHNSNLKLQNACKELHASNEKLQDQISTILSKMSDMQRDYEQMANVNANLQNQLSYVNKSNEMLKYELSLTQQQLVGVQSMMTCSRLWVVSHDQFTIGREIGRGAWATVHEATFRGATVAAKRLYDEIISPDYVELFHQEMQMALHCQHHNIVTFLGVTLENHPIILMELMDGSLRDAYTRGDIKDHQVVGILQDVASALNFLHTRPDPVIHRDVSSANVLLKAQYNGEWLAKLGDLGTAKIQKYVRTPGPGALAYSAPEVGDPKCHSAKMDVYSFGILAVEILTKTLPFHTLDALKSKVRQQFPQYHQLVTSCTNYRPSNRSTMYDVIKQLEKIKAV